VLKKPCHRSRKENGKGYGYQARHLLITTRLPVAPRKNNTKEKKQWLVGKWTQGIPSPGEKKKKERKISTQQTNYYYKIMAVLAP